MQSAVVFVHLILALLTPALPEEAERLHRFAPEYVSVAQAYFHLWAARIAAARYSVDAGMVLAISYHESHFTDNAVGKEANGHVSCGVMTPYPANKCAEQSLLDQYLEGARHWAVDWKRAPGIRSPDEIMLGYAGGYRLIWGCRKGSVLRHRTWGDDLCKTPGVFRKIRERIIGALTL